ncbi:MAG: hypothetical protein H6559_16040 [Lewinellaceae bacterium]|nr:hypothetical protein [Lewinellaceae bacterium]
MKRNITGILMILPFLITCGPAAIAQLSFGKAFHQVMGRADDAYAQERYREAGRLYDEALELKNGRYPLSGYYGDACKAWIGAGEADRALFYLEKLAREGWISLHDLKNSRYFDGLREDERWAGILQIVEEKEQLYGTARRRLEKIRREDQALRQVMGCAKEKFSGDSLSLAYFFGLMGRQDSLNLAQVEGIVAEYGWLGEHKIGDEANGTLWLVVQHASLETQEKYLPVIEASVLRGETPPAKLAFLRDRMAYHRREKQYYGTQVVQIKETGEYKPYPIADPERVDQRRREIGLEPLADYLDFFGIREAAPESLDDDSVLEYLKKQE